MNTLPNIAPKSRPVVLFDGAQIRDARERVYIEFAPDPKPALKAELRRSGWRPVPDRNLWHHKSLPIHIFEAQAVLARYFRVQQ